LVQKPLNDHVTFIKQIAQGSIILTASHKPRLAEVILIASLIGIFALLATISWSVLSLDSLLGIF
jgi:hypothetical protein